jgi:hypothetical protein
VAPDTPDTEPMRTLAAILALITAFSGWQMLRRYQNERHLAVAVSAVAGRDVGVRCPGFFKRLVEITPYAGWVEHGEDGALPTETELSSGTCGALEKLWRRDTPPEYTCLESRDCSDDELRGIDGLTTLAHEAWHLRGVWNEAQTHCYAVQSVEVAAPAFGLGAAAAGRVATAAALVDSRRPQGTYRDHARCRPGGEYDLHPETPAWPG